MKKVHNHIHVFSLTVPTEEDGTELPMTISTDPDFWRDGERVSAEAAE